MTTPNEELINNLTIKAGIMEMGEKIAWGSDTALMRQAAATLQSQAERIKELELDLDVQAGSIEAVQTVNARQAERIKELERTPQVGYFYKWKEAIHGIAKLMDERDTLRAQLAEIEKAEPVAIALNTGTRQAVKWLQNIPHGEKLFTHPMPAQDVTELVDALERVLNCCDIAECGTVPNSPGALKNARTALSKYKGAK